MFFRYTVIWYQTVFLYIAENYTHLNVLWCIFLAIHQHFPYYFPIVEAWRVCFNYNTLTYSLSV